MTTTREGELEQQLLEELRAFGLACTEEQASQLVRHLLLVIEKNKVVNLTRILDERDAITLHIVDSLLPLACSGVYMGRSDRFVDMGTGAGFPGVPLAIYTGANGLLVDSVRKKVDAVNEFIEELHLRDVVAVHSRIEDLPSEHLGSYTKVFARAVAQSNVLVEYATPLLLLGGLLVLEKGNPSSEEVEAASRAASICGLSLVSQESFELPRELGHREILIFEKTGAPRIHLPRKAGTAKREPLGL